jgi:hypothetical protein
MEEYECDENQDGGEDFPEGVASEVEELRAQVCNIKSLCKSEL